MNDKALYRKLLASIITDIHYRHESCKELKRGFKNVEYLKLVAHWCSIAEIDYYDFMQFINKNLWKV